MSTDPWVTEYGVQPFKVERRALKADEPRTARNADHARRLAERLSPSRAGVVAFSRRSAPDLGEYEDPVILETLGDVPEEFGSAS